MSLQSWLPSWPSHRREEEGPFAEFHKQMDELFDDWARSMRAPVAARHETGIPRPTIDVSETDDAFKIIAELPGVDTENVNAEMKHGTLTVTIPKTQSMKAHTRKIEVKKSA